MNKQQQWHAWYVVAAIIGVSYRPGDETAPAIDAAVQAIVTTAFDRAVAILEAHQAALKRGAKLLLERETLDESALESLREEVRAASAPSEAPVN